MQMTCTILHSGKQKPIYNSQKKVERKSCFLFYSTALSWASKEPPQKNQGACNLHLSASPTAHLSSCWCSAEMVRWPDYTKHDLISDVLIPCFYILLLISVHAEVIYTQTIQLGRSGVKNVWVDGREVSSMPEGVWRRRGGWVGGEGMYCERNPFYTVCLPGWMAIHLELQVISSLTARPVLSADSKMKKIKIKKNKTDSQRQNRKHHSQSDKKNNKTHKKKHIQSEDPNSPSTHVRPFPAIKHKNIQNKRFYFCFFLHRDALIQRKQTGDNDADSRTWLSATTWPISSVNDQNTQRWDESSPSLVASNQ